MVGRVRRKLGSSALKVVQSRKLGRLYSPRRPSGPGQKISGTRSSSAFISMPPVGRVQPGWKSSPSRRRVRHQPDNGNLRAHDCQQENGHALHPVNLVQASTLYQTVLGKLSSFDRGVKRPRFAVLREATVPAVLIEGGFLTEPTEAAQIASANWRQQYADAIAAGIWEYKRLAERRVLPRALSAPPPVLRRLEASGPRETLCRLRQSFLPRSILEQLEGPQRSRRPERWPRSDRPSCSA